VVGRVLPFLVGIGTDGTHCSASLGSKPTAGSSTTWFSGRARVVYHDYGLYRCYITPLSAIYCCVHLPVFPFFIAGFVLVCPVEELQLELPRCFFYSIMYLRGDLGRLLETKDLYLRISYVSRHLVHILNLSHPEAF